MRKKSDKISNAVIRRLPRYRRYLYELKKKDVEKISSKDFSAMIGYTASQIRQDLNNFGEFGQQGYGYNVEYLYDEISAILGLDHEYKMVLIGAGNLGQAISKYVTHMQQGFNIVAAFEVKKELIGKSVEGIPIYDYENLVDYVEKHAVDIGIICVNTGNAQEVADRLCFAGIGGIWNFALVDLEVPKYVALESVQMADSLHSLAYHMTDRREEWEAVRNQLRNDDLISKEKETPEKEETAQEKSE